MNKNLPKFLFDVYTSLFVMKILVKVFYCVSSGRLHILLIFLLLSCRRLLSSKCLYFRIEIIFSKKIYINCVLLATGSNFTLQVKDEHVFSNFIVIPFTFLWMKFILQNICQFIIFFDRYISSAYCLVSYSELLYIYLIQCGFIISFSYLTYNSAASITLKYCVESC